MHNQSVPRAKRQPSVRFDAIPASDRGASLIEPLEPRTLLSAGDWRLATGLVHTVTRYRSTVVGHAAGSGDQAYFTGGTFADDRATQTVGIYDAKTGRWSQRRILSEARQGGMSIAVGRWVLFGFGSNEAEQDKATIDVYDTKTHRTTTTQLPHYSGEYLVPAAAGVDGVVVFDTGDIYNPATGQWTTTFSPEAQDRHGVATSVGDLAIFGGGLSTTDHSHFFPTDLVDIYNAKTGLWSTAHLSVARASLTVTSVGHFALFAGGYDGATEFDTVDVYDADTGQWSVAHLSSAREFVSATAIGNLAIFVGGYTSQSLLSSSDTSTADVYDAATGQWFTTALGQASEDPAATTAAGKALFGSGGSGPTFTTGLDIFTPVPGIVGSISGKPGGTINVTVQSTGDAALPAGTIVSVYASPDGSLTGAMLLGTATLPAGLAAQSSATLPIPTSLASVPSGRYHLIAAANDSTGLGPIVIASQPKSLSVRRHAQHTATKAASGFRGLFAR